MWNKLYKRHLFFNQPIIRFPEGERFEDHFVTYKLLYRANRIAVVAEPLYYYVQRKGSITHSFRADDVIYHANYILAYYQWADEMAPELRPVVEYRCLRLFNGLVRMFAS